MLETKTQDRGYASRLFRVAARMTPMARVAAAIMSALVLFMVCSLSRCSRLDDAYVGLHVAPEDAVTEAYFA